MKESTSTTLQGPSEYSAVLSAGEAEAPFWKRIEIFLPIVFVLIHGAYYNPLGELTSLRGVDFGPFLETPLDTAIPFSVLYIIPYIAIWFMPVFMIIHLSRQPDFNIATIRRVTFGFIALILISYVLWLAFPSSFTARADEAALAHYGWVGKFMLLTYQNISCWNSCPSFHVSAPWLICRILKLYTGKSPWYVWTTAIAIFLSTVGIRIHYFLDIVGGILVAEAVYQFVLVRIEKRKLFEQATSRKMVSIYTYGIIVAVGLLGVLIAVITN